MNRINWKEEDTVGKILPNGDVEKEYHGQGCIYKNFKAFQDKSDEVCYVPELSDEKYTYKDFLDAAQKFIDENEDVKEYCQSEDTTAEDIAENLFDMVDWQAPETLIADWEINGSYTE